MKRFVWCGVAASALACNQLAGLTEFEPSSDGNSGGTQGGDGDGDDPTSGGGANLGGDASSGGNGGDGSGGGVASGGDGSGGDVASGGTASGGAFIVPEECDSYDEASGLPLMIDDFDVGELNGEIPNDDGRSGRWTYTVWETGPDSNPVMEIDAAGAEASAYFMRIACGAGYGWCEGVEDPATDWQWASLRLTFRGDGSAKDCYDASVHTGVSLWLRGPGEPKIEISMGFVYSDIGTGAIHKTEELTLSNTWTQYQIPFDVLEQPEWGAPANLVFDPHTLLFLDINVRTVEPADPNGEVLIPYAISVDEVSFY